MILLFSTLSLTVSVRVFGYGSSGCSGVGIKIFDGPQGNCVTYEEPTGATADGIARVSNSKLSLDDYYDSQCTNFRISTIYPCGCTCTPGTNPPCLDVECSSASFLEPFFLCPLFLMIYFAVL